MTRDEVQAWLDRYVEAWRRNERDAIAALFSEDVVYRWRPYGDEVHAVRGRDAVVAAWLEEGDPPGSWEARYEPYAVDRDRAVAVGTSRYRATEKGPERAYANCFLLRFAPDGRCVEFTEFYMEHRAS